MKNLDHNLICVLYALMFVVVKVNPEEKGKTSLDSERRQRGYDANRSKTVLPGYFKRI